VWHQSRREVNISVSVGAQVGVLLGAVHVRSSNHMCPSDLSFSSSALSPVFLMLALFGTAGSAAWERTQSLVLAVIAGVWCAMVAILIALCVAFGLNLAFEGTLELQLHEAFAARGMNDPGAFLVKNMLEATSEGLVRMPIFAVFLFFSPTSPARMQLRSLPTRRPQCLDQALNREIQVFHRRFFFLYILNALPT
jgi:hypothetical protein